MTHFSKCDIFNQFYSFKVRLSERIQFAGLKYAGVFFFSSSIRIFTQMNISNLKSALEQKCILLAHSRYHAHCSTIHKRSPAIAWVKWSIFFSSGEPDSPYTNWSEFAETKIQCNAFINRWNIANFPKKSKQRIKKTEELSLIHIWRCRRRG